MLQAEEVATLGSSGEPIGLSSSLQITSKLFPQARVAAAGGDSSHDDEEELAELVASANKAPPASDLESAAIAVAQAAGRVNAYAPSPSVQAAMSWMAAIRGSTSVDPADKIISRVDESVDTEGERKRKFSSLSQFNE